MVLYHIHHIGLGLSSTPYSKSHARRLKRKAREQIASGLDDVVAALPPIIANAEVTLASSEGKTNSSDAKGAHSNKRQAQNGLIGEGKGAPLSKNQRKNVLYVTFYSVLVVMYIDNPVGRLRK